MMPNNSAYRDNASSTFGMDITWWNRGIDTSFWRARRSYPSFGLRASYAHIPNSLAGDRFGLVGMLRQPLFRYNRWDWSVGLGLSAYTRPRSITGDTNNIFIGSLINCLIDIGITYHPVDQLYLSARVLHTSNGMLMWPNMGLNYFQLDLGYTFGQRVPREFPTRVAAPSVPPAEFGIAFSPGMVMSRFQDFDGYFFCYDLCLYYQHYASPVVAFGGAVDLWYNTSDSKLLEQEESPYRLPLYVSAMAMTELFWGPVSLKVGMGPNILVSPHVTILYYERVGAYYNFGRNFVGVAVNAHAGRVEFIEWTYGRRIAVK